MYFSFRSHYTTSPPYFFILMLITSYTGAIVLLLAGLMFGFSGGDFPLFIWVGLELMTWGCLSFFFLSKIGRSGEILMKFFLIQSMGAIIWFLTFIPLVCSSGGGYLSVINMLAILLKMGIFPFVGWVIDLILEGEYIILILLLGPQKILPMLIFSGGGLLAPPLFFVEAIILMNLYFMFMGFMKMDNLKFYILLSSLYHTSMLILFFILFGTNIMGMVYFFYYIIFFLLFTMFLYSGKVAPPMGGLPYQLKEWSFFLFFLSMSGFPPYSMFFLKLFFFNLFFSIWEDFFFLLLIPPMFLYMVIFMWFVLGGSGSQSPVEISPLAHNSGLWREEQEYFLMSAMVVIYLYILLFF